MKERKHATWHEKKPIDEYNTGESHTEQKSSMTIADMYSRMMDLGEIRDAMQRKNTTMDRKAAEALMDEANLAPQYLPDGERKVLEKKLAKAEKTIAKEKSEAEFNKLVEKEIERRNSNEN